MKRSVVIVSGVRTPIGGFGGSLASITPCELATAVAREAIARAGIEPDQVEQTIFGNVIHTKPEDMYISRIAAIHAGVPNTSPALTLNRLCGSGLQAVISAAEQIVLGEANIVLAGGVESMSRSGHLLTDARNGQKLGDLTAIDMMVGALTDPFGHGHMGMTAENVAELFRIGRAQQDAYAVESHRRAATAIADGRFCSQILPIPYKQGRTEKMFDTDEHVRLNVTLEDIAKLRPAFKKGGTVTAGNALALMMEQQH